jgi:L-asparaginase
MARPQISIGSLGGTIASAPDASTGGATPSLTADALIGAVPGLNGIADIRATSLFQLASGSLTFGNLIECLRFAEQAVAAGSAAVVLTQGTDTLEETAFLLDLLWSRPEPIVLTGAMRTAAAVSPDGPRNLLGAVATAAAPQSRGRGALVVMNDLIHEARWVRKAHSLAVEAFDSPNAGPAGALVEGEVCYLRPPSERATLPLPGRLDLRVPLIEACFGDEGALLDAVAEAGCQGLVIAAFGAGHLPAAWADRVEALAKKIPIVVASRTGAGSTASRTYSYPGSEMDIARRGAWLAGWLPPRKARILLWTALAAGVDHQACRNLIAQWAGLPTTASQA